MTYRDPSYTRLWAVWFDSIGTLTSFPRPSLMARDRAISTGYRSIGRYRDDDICIFHYTFSGRGLAWNGRQCWEVHPHHGFLSIVNDPESGYQYHPDGVEPWDFIWIGFGGSNVKMMVQEMIDTYGPLYAIPAESNLIHRLLSFQSGEESRLPIDPLVGSELIFYLLTQLGITVTRSAPVFTHRQIVESIITYIDFKHGIDVSACTIAKQMDLSREYISRIFHAEMGVSLREYLLRERIVTACHLLKETNLSIKVIAVRLGYETTSNFTRAFTRLLHLSPSAFRQRGIMPHC
ncbi:MAG: helix-turn-helix transcriptional regulator [Armatimonadota bacterium]